MHPPHRREAYLFLFSTAIYIPTTGAKKKKKNGDEARKKAKSHEKKTFFETIRTGNQWCGGEGGKERGERRERDSSTRHSL